MIDWESGDPELREMREDFVRSLAPRREVLELYLRGGSAVDAAQILELTHKLAGVAATYGFPALTRISEAIEEFLDATGVQCGVEDALDPAILLLTQALAEAETGHDPSRLAGDPRLERLISGGGSIPSGSTP